MRHESFYIRPLEPDDVDRVAALLDASMAHDSVTPAWVSEKTAGDPDYDPRVTLCASDGGALVGFAQGIVRPRNEQPSGCIKWFATAEGARGGGVATTLFDKIERAMYRKGVRTVSIASLPPNYTMPGLDPRYTDAYVFLERRGYRKTSETFNMTCNLGERNWDTRAGEERLRSNGISVRRAVRSDLSRVRDHMMAHFPGWMPEAAACFVRSPISLHIAVSGKEERVVGFSAYDACNHGMGWFGPMGSDPEMRGRGIGTVLLHLCLFDLRAQGHSEAVIPWVGPLSFYYRQCGAVVSRVFWQMAKRLDD